MNQQTQNWTQQRPGQPVPSQYRGYQKPFQPTGPVQSFYQPQQAQFGAGAFHTPAYRGSRPNHDAPLRADSVTPTAAARAPQSAGAFAPQSQPGVFAPQGQFGAFAPQSPFGAHVPQTQPPFRGI